MIKSFADVDKSELRGMVRRMDNLGRILVPKEYRKELGLETDNRIEITALEDGLLVRPLCAGGPGRRIDALGRVNVPVGARRTLGIEFYDELEMFLLRDGMFIRKKAV